MFESIFNTKSFLVVILIVALAVIVVIVANRHIQMQSITRPNASNDYRGFVAPGVEVIPEALPVTDEYQALPEDNLPEKTQTVTPPPAMIHYNESELPHEQAEP